MVFETIAYSVPPPRLKTNRTAGSSSVAQLGSCQIRTHVLQLALRGGGELMIDPSDSDPWADYECVAAPPDVVLCGDPRYLGASYVYLLALYSR